MIILISGAIGFLLAGFTGVAIGIVIVVIAEFIWSVVQP